MTALGCCITRKCYLHGYRTHGQELRVHLREVEGGRKAHALCCVDGAAYCGIITPWTGVFILVPIKMQTVIRVSIGSLQRLPRSHLP